MGVKTFHIKTFDLKGEKPEMVYANSLHIHPDYLHWEVRMDSVVPVDPEDPALGWKNSITDYHGYVKRDTVTMIERYWANDNDVFLIELTVPGNSGMFRIKFETEAEADKILAELLDWWLS